jgi:hypothetical protein
VKYHFLLGYETDLQIENPGWPVTKTSRRELQEACHDLIKAGTKERERNEWEAAAAQELRAT